MEFKRVQRKRTAGYKTPSNTKYVGRPTKWSNPFSVEKYGRQQAVEKYKAYIIDKIERKELNLEELRNKNLSCWCGPSKACHIDVLMELLYGKNAKYEKV